MHDSMDTTIPPLYAPWLRDIVGGPIPAETRATCDRCVMLPTEGSAPDAVFFSPITKCCTYQPTIPNFLAGRIWADGRPTEDALAAILADRNVRVDLSLVRRMVDSGFSGPNGPWC